MENENKTKIYKKQTKANVYSLTSLARKPKLYSH